MSETEPVDPNAASQPPAETGEGAIAADLNASDPFDQVGAAPEGAVAADGSQPNADQQALAEIDARTQTRVAGLQGPTTHDGIRQLLSVASSVAGEEFKLEYLDSDGRCKISCKGETKEFSSDDLVAMAQGVVDAGTPLPAAAAKIFSVKKTVTTTE